MISTAILWLSMLYLKKGSPISEDLIFFSWDVIAVAVTKSRSKWLNGFGKLDISQFMQIAVAWKFTHFLNSAQVHRQGS